MERDSLKIDEKKNDETLHNKLISKFKSNIKNLTSGILDMPKWWYPVLIVSWWVWFVLWCTILIWFPWTTLVFVYWWLKVVTHVDEQIWKIVKKTKEKVDFL